MSRLLVVDVGNTNIVIGVYRGDRLAGSWRLATARERTIDEYGILARQLVGELGDDGFEGAIVSSVVPPLDTVIETMIERYFEVPPLFVRPGVKTGLAVQTENPVEVGADRIVNAVAAWELHGGPTIIVDFGTATTFDVVSERGEYRGGLIAPGPTISFEALFARAARLPRVEFRRPEQLIGTSTVTSMQSGMYFGYLGLVDGILQRMIDELGGIRRVIATGGVAPVLAHESRFIEEVDLELTLKGLKIIWDRNRPARRTRGT
jgi:type III pantothenate kinase